MTSTVSRRLALVASFLFSQAILFLALRPPVVPGEGSWLQAFRGYFSYDQLSYAAIATTTAAGVPGTPEPFTETGISYYPSLWYRLLGWISAATGWSVPAVWTLAGYALLMTAVAVVGYVAYRVSERWWAPALVAPALTVGTLSVVLSDGWYTTLDSHAVLWGPYGALFVLNGEVAGFACASIGLALAARVVMGPPMPTRLRGVTLIVAAILVGITGNFQTYSFLVASAIAFAWLGALGLVRARSRALLIATTALVVLTFVLGPIVSARAGGLLVYGFLIACTLPGVIFLARTHWRVLLVPALVYVVAASPQVLHVMSGTLSNDAFLAYRQEQSGSLGVPFVAGLLATLPLALVWLFNLLVQRQQRNPGALAALAATAFALVMLASNNAWGFGQEPYRMWIDSVTLTALVLVPVTAWSLSRGWGVLRQEVSTIAVGVVAASVVVLALLDFGAFRTYVRDSGMIRFDSARYLALGSLTAPVDGLLAPGPCLDPKEVKIATRKPVAFYNLGLAWPADKQAIDAVITATTAGTFDADVMRAAKVQYVVTDSTCGTQWPLDQTMGVIQEASADYADEMGAGTLTLWRIY